MLKSPKAFEAITFVSCKPVDSSVYFQRRKARDEQARAAFLAKLEKEDVAGLYMMDILREEVRPNDSRLR